VAAFRFTPDHRISNLIRSVESAERQRQLQDKKAAGDLFWEDYERDLARLDEAYDKIRDLEAENANLKANQQVLVLGALAPVDAEEAAPDEPASFDSVREAVHEASKRSRNVEFLSSAYSSADKSPFHRPFDVFKALTDLDEIVEAWQQRRDEKG